MRLWERASVSSIFISYRSRDYDSGVADLCAMLANEFGEDQITLDRSSFAPGANWLPQIRSKVAMCDVVIFAIGTVWTSNAGAQSDGPIDYVIEELTLAKQLGKSILPVALGVNPSIVTSSLPSRLAWIADLHFIRFDPASRDLGAVCAAITALGGPRVAENSTGLTSVRTVVSMMSLLAQKTLGSIFRPTSHSAAALQSTSLGVRRSGVFACTSIALLCVAAILISGELTLFVAAKVGASFLLATLMVFAVLTLAGQLADTRPSAAAIASFSVHCTAAFCLALTLWLFVFWFLLPDAVQNKFTAMAASELPFAQQAQALERELTLQAKLVLAAIQLGALAHLTFIVFGASRAGVIALGWKRWTLALPLTALVVVFILALLILLSTERGLKPGNLPMEVRFTSVQDVMDSGVLKKSPLILEAVGKIEKRPNSIAFVVSRFRAENRTVPDITIQALMCALGTIKAGNFEWPETMHESRIFIGEPLRPGVSVAREGLAVEVPLGPEFQSGNTAVSCFVETSANSSYPIGNGRWNVLRW